MTVLMAVASGGGGGVGGYGGSDRSGRNQYVMSQREERAALPEDSETFL